MPFGEAKEKCLSTPGAYRFFPVHFMKDRAYGPAGAAVLAVVERMCKLSQTLVFHLATAPSFLDS